jgi:hypothetical protein
MQLTILTNVLTKIKDIDQTIDIFSTSTTGLGSIRHGNCLFYRSVVTNPQSGLSRPTRSVLQEDLTVNRDHYNPLVS